MANALLGRAFDYSGLQAAQRGMRMVAKASFGNHEKVLGKGQPPTDLGARSDEISQLDNCAPPIVTRMHFAQFFFARHPPATSSSHAILQIPSDISS